MKDLNGEKRHVALMKGENENDGPIPANYMYCLSPPSLFGDCCFPGCHHLDEEQ